MADTKISGLPSASTPLAGTEVLPIVQGGVTDKVSIDDLTAGRQVNMGSANIGGGTAVTEWNLSAAAPVMTATATNGASGLRINVVGGGSNVLRVQSAGVSKLELNGNNLKINSGSLQLGTAGQGIDFSADSHAAGMTSELLDDYEEGTWTPAVEGSTSAGTGTYGSQLGYYTKIGNIVYFQLWLQVLTHTGTGNTRITGLPFTSRNVFGNGGATLNYAANLNFTANYVAQIQVAQNATYMNLSQYLTGGGSGVVTTGIPVDANMQVQISGFYLV